MLILKKSHSAFLRTAIVVLFSAGACLAQPAKFGKISNEELNMTVYEKDTSAAAVVLFDVGHSYFQYSKYSGWQLIHDRHKRVKILKKEGYDFANVTIALHDQGSTDESISGLKGFTYVLENGKEEKYKLEKDGIFEEEVSETLNRTKITMPNVREGAVIEYKYTITSDFLFSLRGWYFQDMIPIAWSEYTVEIPEYFYYKKLSQGFLPFADITKEQEMRSFTLSQKVRSESNNVISSETHYANVDYMANIEKWVMKNAPALELESYVTTYEDYVSQIKFQLATIKYPNEPAKNVANTWDGIAKDLMDSDKFGKQLNRTGFAKLLLEGVDANFEDPSEKAAVIFEAVRKNVRWNQENALFIDKNIRKVWDEKSGNVAEINLMLTALLNEEGIEAYPVLLSTRSNGRLNPTNPLLADINYVITFAKIGEKAYLLDATDPLLPMGMLPFRTLNDKGIMLTSNGTQWVNLQTGGEHSQSIANMLTLSAQGTLKGQLQIRSMGYLGRSLKSTILSSSEEEYLKEHWNEPIQGFQLSEGKIEQVKDIGKPVKTSFTIENTEALMGDRIYLSPILLPAFEENPFKLEKRLYPVDLGAPIQNSFNATIMLPANFEVEELPEAIAIGLPNNGGKFIHKIVQRGKNLSINSTLKVDKTFFTPEEYLYLKEFIAQVIEKQSEQIVLKKNKT